MAREVQRDERPAEGQRDRVPGVRVLRAAVNQHELGFTVAPDERADLLAASHVDSDPRDRRIAAPRDVELGGVLPEQAELVVGHGGSRPQGARPVQPRRPFHAATAFAAAPPLSGWGTPLLITAGENWYESMSRPVAVTNTIPDCAPGPGLA